MKDKEMFMMRFSLRHDGVNGWLMFVRGMLVNEVGCV